MNFQQVKNANSQNVTMFGTFNEIGGVSFTQNQKQVSKCQIIDDNGEKHLVRLYGTMPTPALLNMRQQFSLSSYQGQTQQGQPYTGFSGFWNDRAMVNQVPGSPPQPQQAAPQPAQRPNVPPPAPAQSPQGMKMPDTYAYPSTPEVARRVVRTDLIVAMLRNGQKPLLNYVEELTDFAMTGKVPDPALKWEGKEKCVHCGKPYPECSCTPAF